MNSLAATSSDIFLAAVVRNSLPKCRLRAQMALYTCSVSIYKHASKALFKGRSGLQLKGYTGFFFESLALSRPAYQ